MFGNVYKGKRVLITGHTGFKGSWLSLWLVNLGADVIGYSLNPPTTPNHFDLLKLDMNSIIGDIRDRDKLEQVFKKYKPEVVFHLAAQPLVRYSYINPVETFETNVIGTLNVFEACRKTETVRCIINITSDKCYENKEWIWGYREIDTLGGYDPYSASKACSEILTNSYRLSFFHPDEYNKKHNILLSSVRAGNVIGGGDWSEDRLIPDIVRSIVNNQKLYIRYPNAIRPWQHVLEPLSGYLLLGQKLLEGKKEFASSWNFGPEEKNYVNVETIVKKVKNLWDKFDYEIYANKNFHESTLLKLDCSKAIFYLKWRPLWDLDKALEMTINWYKEYYENNNIISLFTIKEYEKEAEKVNIEWFNL